MSAAVLDVFCHACERTSLAEEFPADLNEEGDRICPQCSSEFVELREQQTPVPTNNLVSSATINNISSNSTRRTFTAPNGVNMELHVTTAVLPPELYDMLSRSGTSGVSMVFSMDNGSLVPASNLRSFQFGDNDFEALLDRLAQQYRPPTQPTAQHVIDSLPRRPVRELGDAQVAEVEVEVGTGHYASCRTGEPCPVCHDEFSGGTTVTELPCQHCFHEDCILPWLQEHNTCPVCRFKLDNEAASPPRRPTNPSASRNRPPTHNESEEDPLSALVYPDSEDHSGSSSDSALPDLPGQLRQHLSRRPRPRPSRSGSAASAPPAEPTAAASAAGTSPHPVRTSSGSAFVRTGPYTRLDEELRSAAAESAPPSGARRPQALGGAAARQQDAQPLSSRLMQELSSLTARRDLLDDALEPSRDLHQRLLHLLQRHGVPDAHAAAVAAAASGPTAAGSAGPATRASSVRAGAAVDDDGGPGGHLSASQLEELNEEISAAADLADSILLDLPQQQGPAAAGAAGDGVGATAAARVDVGNAACGGLQAGSVVTNGDFVVAVGTPAPAAEQQALQARPRRLPLVIRVLSGMLSWAFRRVRNLLQMR